MIQSHGDTAMNPRFFHRATRVSICIFLLSLGLCVTSLGFAASLSPTTPCESLLQLNGPFDHEGAIAFPEAARLFQNKRAAGFI
jgi:hypothetical protein